METFLEQLFHADGTWNTEQNFTTEKPGTSYEYSNIGAALLAYCIQLSMGEDYRELTQKWILDPLHMDRSGWSASTVDQYNHIAYYNEIYNPVPSYSCITYPDGGLYSTVHDLTIFMQEMMKGYQGKSKLLTKASFREMMSNQIPDTGTATGLIWDLDIDCCIGHGGNDFGLATLMYFNPDSGIGKILFTNISLEKEEIEDQFYSIFNALFKYDSDIETSSE